MIRRRFLWGLLMTVLAGTAGATLGRIDRPVTAPRKLRHPQLATPQAGHPGDSRNSPDVRRATAALTAAGSPARDRLDRYVSLELLLVISSVAVGSAIGAGMSARLSE